MEIKLGELMFQRIRLSDQVKHVLKRSFLQGELKQGDKLPREDQIATQLKVSKVTVREALKDMEAEGLIEKRRGALGGNFVVKPGAAKMGDLMTNYYQFGTITPEELTDFRNILEPVFISIAAERRTDEDLERMKANLIEFEQSLNEGKRDIGKGLMFHRLIADACHNKLISIIMEALGNVFESILSRADIPFEEIRGDLEFNKKFYDCILQQNAKRAKEVMVDHFKTFMNIIERKEAGERRGD